MRPMTYWIPAATFLAGGVLTALTMNARYDLLDAEKPPPAPQAAMVLKPDAPATESPLPASRSAVAEVESPDQPSTSPASSLPPELMARLQGMAAGWSRLDTELQRLRQRVDVLEGQLAATVPAAKGKEASRPQARTAAERQAAMEAAGVTADLAEDIVWRQERHELDRLELRDQAMREDWFGTDRYRRELRRLREERPDVRAELGDEGYDRFLYETGENNRVRIDGVIGGSAADEAGLQPGDVIEAYGADKVFTFAELRRATREGEIDELVPVRVRRGDGSRVQAWVRRGPLGVRMGLVRVDPDV